MWRESSCALCLSLISSVAALLTSCSTPAMHQVLDRGEASGITEEERQVIVVGDAASFDALHRRVMSTLIPPPPAPSIDFAKRIVVFVSIGQRSSGGYGLEIKSVACAGTSIEITVDTPEPTGELRTMMITHPYALVACDRCTGATQVRVKGGGFDKHPPVPIASKLR